MLIIGIHVGTLLNGAQQLLVSSPDRLWRVGQLPRAARTSRAAQVARAAKLWRRWESVFTSSLQPLVRPHINIGNGRLDINALSKQSADTRNSHTYKLGTRQKNHRQRGGKIGDFFGPNACKKHEKIFLEEIGVSTLFTLPLNTTLCVFRMCLLGKVTVSVYEE